MDNSKEFREQLCKTFNLKTDEDVSDFIDTLERIKKTGCAYPTVMKSETLPKITTQLFVHDVMRFTEDLQRVIIRDNDKYDTETALYIGDALGIPTEYHNRKVSKIYSDYVYSRGIFNSYIVLRII